MIASNELEAAGIKAEIAKGLDADKATQMIDGINDANKAVKKVEALVLPFLNILLPSINVEAIARDVQSGEAARFMNSLKLKSNNQQLQAVLQFANEKGYLSGEALGALAAGLPQLMSEIGSTFAEGEE